jgi:hypothetical protein
VIPPFTLAEGCEACVSDAAKCASEWDACNGDARCSGLTLCLLDPQTCCLTDKSFAENGAYVTLYACVFSECNDECAPQQPTCADCMTNGDESDLDCGGDSCLACEVGQACRSDYDCHNDGEVVLSCGESGTCG